MKKIRGTVRRLGLEGGVWALVGDDGEQYHLLEVPDAMKEDGMRAEVEGDRPEGASIAMVGQILRVRGFRRV